MKISKKNKMFLFGIIVVILLIALAIEQVNWKKQQQIRPQAPTEVISQEMADAREKELMEISSIESYTGEATVSLSQPYFSEKEVDIATKHSYMIYSEQDELGRTGAVLASLKSGDLPGPNAGLDSNSREENDIDIKPSGWNNQKYDCIEEGEEGYVYDRCNLIAWDIGGDLTNKNNIITGTQYMINTMKEYEDMIYLALSQRNDVLYRVTPIYEGDNLICSGVLIEAQTINTDDLQFSVFCYNVQPGIDIDYSTGDTSYSGDATFE